MSEWKEYKLNDLVTKLGDGLHGTPNYDPNGEYYFINGSNLINGKISLNENTKRVSNEEFDKYKKELTDRTILVSINGTLGNIATYNNEKVILGKSACYFNVKEDVCKEFIKYIATDNSFQHYISEYATGSTIKNVPLKAIREYSFKLPDFQTQKSIAEILSSLDDKIELNNKINQELETLAQTLFKQWFIDFEFPNENGEPYKSSGGAMVDSELGEIPRGWEVKKLSQIIKLIGGGTPKRSESKYWNGNIPWFSVQDVPNQSDIVVVDTKEKISLEGLNNSSAKLLMKGTTIITARGTVGKLAFVSTPMAMNQSCYGVIGIESIGPIFNYFNLSRSVNELKRNTHGAVFDTITSSTFDSISTLLPNDFILEKFEFILNPIFLNFENIANENVHLKNLRDTLLPKLISGELEINEISN